MNTKFLKGVFSILMMKINMITLMMFYCVQLEMWVHTIKRYLCEAFYDNSFFYKILTCEKILAYFKVVRGFRLMYMHATEYNEKLNDLIDKQVRTNKTFADNMLDCERVKLIDELSIYSEPIFKNPL